MNQLVEGAPFLALIDDDRHSATLLTRMLLAHGAPRVDWLGDGEASLSSLTDALSGQGSHRPDMIVVDLKSSSRASAEFLRSIQPLAHRCDVPAVVVAQPNNGAQRDLLEDCGASAVFYRHADPAAYRQEAASMVSFWARRHRPVAVGM
jgi:DNA-binding NarL/FixJ family response regulator